LGGSVHPEGDLSLDTPVSNQPQQSTGLPRFSTEGPEPALLSLPDISEAGTVDAEPDASGTGGNKGFL